MSEFVSVDDSLATRYWMTRKAVVVVAFFGGHRCHELRNLQFSNVRFNSAEKAYVVEFYRAKQRGVQNLSSYIIPFVEEETVPNFGKILKDYIDIVSKDLERNDQFCGPLFLNCGGIQGQKMRTTPMGKNTISKIGKEVALHLHLAHPETYTGKEETGFFLSYL